MTQVVGKDLHGTQLQNKHDIVYSNCNLQNCVITGKFYNIEFYNCDLTGGKFQQVIVKKCKFINCNLTRCKVNKSKWSGIMFAGCYGSIHSKHNHYNNIALDSSNMRW